MIITKFRIQSKADKKSAPDLCRKYAASSPDAFSYYSNITIAQNQKSFSETQRTRNKQIVIHRDRERFSYEIAAPLTDVFFSKCNE